MAFHHPPKQQQGYYRYDPASLKHHGPARIFPFVGEDGITRYLLTFLQRHLLSEGRLSQPWNLLWQQIDRNQRLLEKGWYYLTTQLADLQWFQSGWFNLDLPPDEQFDAKFAVARRTMMAGLLAAQTATKAGSNPAQARSRFYDALELHGQPRPVTLYIHQRDGGLSDREFAYQRLAGQNPMALRQVQPSDQPWLQSWDGQCILANGEGLDLAQAATAHQLFIADYPLLGHLTPGELQSGRYVGSPIAAFYHTPTGLEPVLIQVEPGKAVGPRSDPDAWMRAKLYVQVADVTYHELIIHLCDTHLAMEAFAIATPRQLPANHPVYRLLKPHFQFLLAINTRGNDVLLGEGAAIDTLMAPTREASIGLIDHAYRDRPFQSQALPKNLQQRGVTEEFLPDFPYRDDAVLLWQAIHRYVSNFLQRYYPTEASIQQDPYLQAWAAELGAPLQTRPLSDFPQAPSWLPTDLATQIGLHLEELPSYSRVPGFSAEITNLQSLIEIATQIIFTCGPQHAAVNFSQFDYVGYTANAPLSAYCLPDACSSLAELLPPLEKNLGQIELAFALSGIRWGTLGRSDLMRFVDPGDRAILKQFQAELMEIERKIGDRNQQRRIKHGRDYPYLLPSRIPNSINI